jgi:hypothetical protein
MINKILSKYNGHRNYWFPDAEEENLYLNEETKKKYSDGCTQLEAELLKKYKQYVPKGWYGVDFGTPMHKDWFKILDEFLQYLIKLQNDKKISNFEIHQLKLKFGGLRFYISYSCDDPELIEFIDLQIEKLENTLFDKKLIY